MALTFAALLISLVAAQAAEARVGNDPCKGNDASNVNLPDGAQLQCANVERLRPYDTGQLPVERPFLYCRDGWKMAGTSKDSWNVLTAYWDFWSYNNEWAAWNGIGFFSDGDGYARNYRPTVRNHWLGGSWHVRIFQTCDRTGSRGLSEPPEGEGEAESGDAGENVIEGTVMDDAQLGEGGADELTGGAGDDEAYGGEGPDESLGGAGDDQLISGPGDDVSHGGRGSDELFDDQGHEDLHGGAGDDRFSAHDGDRDQIDCGDGEDIVVADGHDRVAKDCEHVFLTRADTPKVPPET